MGEQERSEGSVSSEQLCRILPVGEGKKRASGAVYGQTGGAGENLNFISQEEIEAIFAQGRKNQNKKENDRRGYRRYHRGARRPEGSQGGSASGQSSKRNGQPKKQCLLVDGYNVIFAWPELAELAKQNLDAARDRLIEEMRGYQGYLGGTLILVFDAYKVKGNLGTVQKWDPIYVVYTKEAETADQYIEKTVHEMASEYEITVATSDGLEQMIIWGEGAIRMSAPGLWEDLERRKVQARKEYGITETDK
ncbi:MAG: NYN domain-containing protein [Lachnospiraceae bacterium]|nr:NYN domain-containing protein [Lachnospiraceae bacterium]